MSGSRRGSVASTHGASHADVALTSSLATVAPHVGASGEHGVPVTTDGEHVPADHRIWSDARLHTLESGMQQMMEQLSTLTAAMQRSELRSTSTLAHADASAARDEYKSQARSAQQRDTATTLPGVKPEQNYDTGHMSLSAPQRAYSDSAPRGSYHATSEVEHVEETLPTLGHRQSAPRVVTVSTLTPLASGVVTVTTFNRWREDVRLQLMSFGLVDYVEQSAGAVYNTVRQHYPALGASGARAHVDEQSQRLVGSLCLALSYHLSTLRTRAAEQQAANPGLGDPMSTPHSLWRLLEQQYGTSTASDLMSYIDQLTTLKHSASTPPSRTLDRVMLLQRQLADAQCALPEKMFVVYVIRSLPADMSTIRDMLLASDVKTLAAVREPMERWYSMRHSSKGGHNASAGASHTAAVAEPQRSPQLTAPQACQTYC